MRRFTRTCCAFAAALAAAAASPASAQEPPSLRLFAADRSVSVSGDELDFSLNLGLWVASTGGEFRIRAQRPGYGRWEGAQVDGRTGAPLRAIPRSLLDGGGLPGFLELQFRNAKGRLAARRTVSLCPGSAARVTADGPPVPTYLQSCGTSFPFVIGTVWGIDRGWASPVPSEGFGVEPALGLKRGRYAVRARIGARYRELFAIPAEQATARLRVRVLRRSSGGGRVPAVPAASGLEPARPFGAAAAQAPPDPATLPDLVALPPWEVSLRSRRGRESLRFAGSPWNAGPGQLLVEGFRRPDENRMSATQYFVDAAGTVTGSAPAGEMEFHEAASHRHWHFLQFVTYRILRPSGQRVVRSRKQSFCMAPTDAVDLTVPGATLVPSFLGLDRSTCGDDRSIWIRQALPAGWGDTYGAFYAGQSFNVTGVPNGRYLLEMQVNPRGQLAERTIANNVARRRFVLRGKPGKRRVRVSPWNGIRE